MANQISGAVANRRSARAPILDGDVIVRRFTHTLTSALANDQYVEMLPVFDGERLLSGKLTVLDDLDSGNALRFNIGDGADEDRYLAANNVGVAGGTVQFGRVAATAAAARAMNHEYDADDAIRVTVQAASSNWPARNADVTIQFGRLFMEIEVYRPA